mmetsp:Transcript_9797/g.28407  ORF Transcript_9797/g.28407 Transcript_9797/m.28407 type:complete len:208 (+) Transcript_9797:2789-3412(+)
MAVLCGEDQRSVGVHVALEEERAVLLEQRRDEIRHAHGGGLTQERRGAAGAGCEHEILDERLLLPADDVVAVSLLALEREVRTFNLLRTMTPLAHARILPDAPLVDEHGLIDRKRVALLHFLVHKRRDFGDKVVAFVGYCVRHAHDQVSERAGPWRLKAIVNERLRDPLLKARHVGDVVAITALPQLEELDRFIVLSNARAEQGGAV